MTTEESTYRRLALTWGVQPLLVERVNDTDAMLQVTVDAACKARVCEDRRQSGADGGRAGQ